jgi:hypothetical protein
MSLRIQVVVDKFVKELKEDLEADMIWIYVGTQ